MKATRERKLEVKGDGNGAEAPLHGDVLELMLSRVPLVDLVPASHVSRAWKHAVSASLHDFNPVKPWLLVHTQGARSPYAATTHAYDPRSHLWMQVEHPPTKLASAVRSSHSTLLYALSPSRFCFSFDPLNLTWHHARPPLVWRTDPIVALVGCHVVVAGGTCDFEDDPLAVETYDLRTRAWTACESMPGILKDSSASTWLSIAANNSRMYVTEKASGVTYSYDPADKAWHGPYDLRPDRNVYYSVIGFANDRLILVGLIGSAENFEGLKIWEVDCESSKLEEITVMPSELGEKLKDYDTWLSSVAICACSDFVYLYNPSMPENLVWCELAASGGRRCTWGSVRNAAANDGARMGRMVFTCANVDVAELQRAVAAGKRRFLVKETTVVN